MRFNRVTALATLLVSISSLATAASIDGGSIEAGGGSKVQQVRFSVQKNWEKRWFQSNGTHLGGYWEGSIAQWRGKAYRDVPGDRQNITSIGITPVLRFQSDDLKGWYAEGGIGVHLFSELYNNDNNQLSTAFQFGDHLGTGYVFNNGWDLGLRIVHYSNGGIKRPNSGVNLLTVKLARPF